MAKQCATVVDNQGNIDSVILKNYDNITPLERAVKRNKGYSLDKASNGEPSLLYQFYTDEMNMSPEEAEFVVANTFSTEFGDWFGRWWEDGADASKVVDINGQPKPVWSGHEERLTTHNAYTNREEDDRISNDAFFPESKKLAQTYSTGGGVDFLNAPAQYVKYLVANSVEPVFLNIRNPRIVEHNKGTQITPLIQSGEAKANDGFYGDSSNQVGRGLKTWAIMDDSQVIYLDAVSEMNNDIQVESDNTIIIESIEKIRNEANSIESETFENVSKNNINFQIIGEKGASKLSDAENIMANNKIAKEMEAEDKDAKTIRLATGWEKGVDGKWRYEIEDIKPFSDVVYDSKTDSYIKNATISDNFEQKRGNKNPDISLTLSDFAPKDILVNEAKKIGVDLGRVFIAYPELRDIKINIDSTNLAKGQFIENRNLLDSEDSFKNATISLSNELSPNEANIVLIHEIQHAIQNIEGFAIGGSSMSKNIISNDIKNILQINKEWRRLVSEREKYPSNEIISKELNDLENDLIISIIKSSMISIDANKIRNSFLKKQVPPFAQKQSIIAKIKGKIELFGRVIEETEDISPNEFYKNLAGEVESRNVQTRANMSIEERKQLLLSETEDIPREEQIQIFEASGIPNSSIELVPSELIKRLTDRLLQKNLVSKSYILSNDAIINKLKELGISDKIAREIQVWHGSPHNFDRFSTDYMSTGEGVQAFGWGLYFTDLKGIAKNYAKKLTPVQKYVRKLPKKIIEVKIDNDTDRIFSEKVLYTGDIYDKSILKDKLLDKIDSYSREMDLIDIKHDRARLTVDGNKATRNNIGYDGLREDFDIVLKYGYSPRSIADMSEDGKNEILEAMSKINNFFKNSYEKLLDNFDKYYIEDLQNTVQPEKPLTNLYNVSLHQGKDPSEYVWLNWYENVSQDIKTRLMPEILKANLKLGIKNNTENGILKENFTGQTLYTIFKDYFKSDKEASLFLLENGIDGIKYPAESISRGVTSETARGFNYVVFDENAITLNEVIQFNKELSNAGLKPIIGGFFNSQTKEVYLNEDSNDLLISTLHEFSHPMLQWLRDNRRGHFDAGIEVLKNNSEEAQAYIDKVKELYPNLKENSDTFYEEVLATIIGDKGAELIRSKEDSNIQTWISDLWKMFKDMMGLTEYSIEEVSNMSLQEFSDAINAEMFNSDGDMKDDTLLQIEVQQNEFIPSQLFEELSQQPFMTKEQALDIYQHIYTEGLNEWKDNDMTC